MLSDPTAVKPSFTADQAGSYVLQLIVNDGLVNSAADTVTVTSNSTSTSTSSGGGGGCAMTTANETPDPLLPALVLLALTGLGARNTRTRKYFGML